MRPMRGLEPPHVGSYNERPLSSFEQIHLLPTRSPKMFGGEVQMISFDAGVALGDLENALDLVGKDASAAHPCAKFRVIQFAAAHGADAVEHLVFAIGKMFSKPLLEER